MRLSLFSRSPILRLLANLRASAPAVFFSVLFLAAAELMGALVLPLLLGEHTYLERYLGSRAVQRTLDFVDDDDPYLIWDSVAGWKNRPQSGAGRWQVDEFGARTTHRISPDRSDGRARILFLGNSLINGGTHVSNQETVSAYAEVGGAEALNFGTMLYSVDQMALSFEEDLRVFHPDWVVVGIPTDPFRGLQSRYVPFLWRGESNMPYVKARFLLEGEEMRLLPPPRPEELATLFSAPDLLDEFEETDGYYTVYARFRRFGLFPILGTLWRVVERGQNLSRRFHGPPGRTEEILLRVLGRLRRSVEGQGARLVLLVLPSEEETFPPLGRGWLPDEYHALLELLDANGIPHLDVRSALRESGYQPWELFIGDGVHFTPLANELMAGLLSGYLASATS